MTVTESGVVTQRNSLKSIHFQIVYLKKKKSKAPEFWYSLFIEKNKDFDNGNSLRMTEQSDILPCYITESGKLELRCNINKLF